MNKNVKILLVLFLLIFVNTGCVNTISSSEYEENKRLAKELFSLQEFPNMTFIEVRRDIFLPIYFVSTAEEFNSIRKYRDRSFIITNDIDLSTIENFQPIGNEDQPFVGQVSSSCILAYYTFGFFSRPIKYCYEGDSYTPIYRVISNAKININDENYQKHVGVFGYTNTYNGYFYQNDVLNASYTKRHDIDYEHIQSGLRSPQVNLFNLIFNNINIDVNTSNETIVGGAVGRYIGGEIYTINSKIKGNYIVGGVVGISESYQKEAGSFLNDIYVDPVINGGYVGGNYGISEFRYIDTLKIMTNNKINVNENQFSSRMTVGGDIGKLIYHRPTYTDKPCYIQKLSGLDDTQYNTANANVGFLFGEVNLKISKNDEVCPVDDENYSKVFKINTVYANVLNQNLKPFYKIYDINRAVINNDGNFDLFNVFGQNLTIKDINDMLILEMISHGDIVLIIEAKKIPLAVNNINLAKAIMKYTKIENCFMYDSGTYKACDDNIN